MRQEKQGLSCSETKGEKSRVQRSKQVATTTLSYVSSLACLQPKAGSVMLLHFIPWFHWFVLPEQVAANVYGSMNQ